jgi:hypothetical protein
MEVLTDAKLFRPFEIEINCSFEKASVEALARVHTNEYIRLVLTGSILHNYSTASIYARSRSRASCNLILMC